MATKCSQLVTSYTTKNGICGLTNVRSSIRTKKDMWGNYMKRTFYLFLALMALLLTGCNMQVIDLNYKFRGIYFNDGTQWHYIEVDSWTDYGDGDDYQFKKDGVAFLINSKNFILVEQRTDYFDELLDID